MKTVARVGFLIPVFAFACAEFSSDLACESCEIQIKYVTTLGEDGDGPGALPSFPTSVARDSKGRYFVTAPYTGEERPFVFDAGGGFVSRLGGVGEGPREFQRAGFLSVSADSVLVYDREQLRITVFTPDLKYVRTVPGIPPIYRWVELSDGTLVANRTDGRFEPLARFSRGGELLAEFGDVYEVFDKSTWLRPVHYISPSSSGGVWSVQLAFSNTVHEWDAEGTLIRSVPVETSWYEPYEMPLNPSPTEMPQSRIIGIWEDGNGLLWIFGMAASPSWQDGLGAPRRIEGQEVHEIIDPSLVYDSVIEVLDPNSEQRVRYQRRFTNQLLWPIQPGLVASAQETDLGFYRIDIFSIGLQVQ